MARGVQGGRENPPGRVSVARVPARSIEKTRRHSCRFVGNKSIYVPGAPRVIGVRLFAFDSPETKINAFRPFSRMKGAFLPALSLFVSSHAFNIRL